ncbi:unnamed protein product [Rotaria sordida]|uniref:Aminotransferase class V domain-containing protein n=1 Tax=Rotaria sordida TaxID=392033 RepID=A0A815UC54_9BILA|nr:unnamed protein product [Rotaria sordida]
MAQSREHDIDYFQSLSNWENRQDIINFLEVYQWDPALAMEAYMMYPDYTNDDQPQAPTFRRTMSREEMLSLPSRNENVIEQLTLDDDDTNYTSEEINFLSNDLYDSLNQQQTKNSSNKIAPRRQAWITQSNRISFNQHVDQLLTSETAKPLTIFPEINQFDKDKKKLLRYIDLNIIGKNAPIDTPFGPRTITYADYTASGRAIKFIEYYILNDVLPYYANTHSENNACALRTTKFRKGPRSLIKKCVNATDDDVIIFTGSGSTAAVNKLVNVLHLKDKDIQDKTVVFISTFEHHSNILPWKETGIELIRIPNTKEGLLDQHFLKTKLKHYHHTVKKHIICSLNAASNVTGIRTDVDTISTLVHHYDGWIFWDYAAAASYVKIDMNPSTTAYKDAVFISTHKFIGGPSTPGILIAKKKLFTNRIPVDCGGGTVNFVTRTNIEYVKDIEIREEGGTPNILGAIRAGLVFHLKEIVGENIIEKRETELVDKFFQRFRNHQKLLVLGSSTVPRLAIFSFLIYVPIFDKYLHHNLISILLNDLFGIQVRSGCACAGPYVLELLNIDDQKAQIYTRFMTEDENGRFDGFSRNVLMKPGFTRFNLSYFASDEEVDYILNALEFIADEGWKFLPLYTYELETAVWRPRPVSSGSHISHCHNLQMITYENGIMKQNFSTLQNHIIQSKIPQSIRFSSSNDPLDQAIAMANNISKYVCENIDFRNDPPLDIPEEYQDFIWFILPKQVVIKMLNVFEQHQDHNHMSIPFRPRNN